METPASTTTPPQLGRRAFLGGVAAVGLSVIGRGPGASAAVSRSRPTQRPRIVIIGAGLAGLTCAFHLHQRGLSSIVYEAHDERIGGRCWTARGFAASQTAEHGGEFIDTVHHRIRNLAATLGLRLDDVAGAGRRHGHLHGRIYLDGAVRRRADVYAHQHLLTSKAKTDSNRIGDYRWDHAGRAARELDEMTGLEWLKSALPDPGDRLLRLATAQYMSEEYGLDLDELSAIAMVSEFGPTGADSDERFHVHGGNDQIPNGIGARLPAGTVRPGHPLSALRRRGDGSYALRFEGSPDEVVADVVVLCLPFTALRRVDLSGAGLSARKRRCIDDLGMGTNAKVLIQLERHLGHYGHFDGEYSDEHIDTWDSSVRQAGRPGLLTVYSGGRTGAGYPVAEPHAAAPDAVVRHTTKAVSRAVTGLAAGYNGRSWLDKWVDDPWTHGSYAAFRPGQFTRYWGFVGLAEGRLHFGGEHTAMAAQGFLEGAVRSGERCAREVLQQVGIGHDPAA